jgi:hypothetical protein
MWVCQNGPFLKPNIPMESSEHPLHMPHIVLAQQLCIQALSSKESSSMAKTCNLHIEIARSDTHVMTVTKDHTCTILCRRHLCMAVSWLVQPVMCFGIIANRGFATRSSDTLAVALTYCSSSSSCRHSFSSGMAPSDCRTAVFGEFCLMNTSFSARSRLKRLRTLV